MLVNLANTLCERYSVEIAVCYKLMDEPAFELEVLRDDYSEILGQIKYELKRYQQLKNESYEAYKRYLAEQKEKKEEKQTTTTANIPDWASRSHIPS